MNKYIGQPKMINKINKDLIKDIVSKNGPISKPELSKMTKLSLPTVNKIVDTLTEEGTLKKACTGESGVGRKPILYEMSGDTGYIIALYIENEYSNGYIKGVLVDLLGNIVYKEHRKIKYSLDDKSSGGLYGFIDSLMDNAKDRESVKAISIAIPGVEDDEGNIYKIPNIPEWVGVNLKKAIEQFYNIPVYVENDVNLTSVGIFHKYFQEKHENIIYVYFGEGIGTGIIIRGKLYKGKNNFAGEISHMVVSTPEEGTLEKYEASGLFGYESLSLINKIMSDKKIKDLLLKNPSNDEIYADKNVKLLIQKISYSIINMIALLNPEVVAVRGVFFNERFLLEVEKIITSYIGQRNCPRLFLLEDTEIGLEGTIKLGLSHSTSNYSFINDKGV